MLVENGFVRVKTSEGEEYTFTPSLGRIATLGHPHEIVQHFVALHGKDPIPTATYILACLADQDDATPLIGWRDEGGWHVGLMPPAEVLIIARHLMLHGIVGKAKPSAGDGKFADKFEASEYIAAARVHLGLSSEDAAALSMTEFQTMFEMKFPQAGKNGGRDVPTREEYDAGMKRFEERRHGTEGR